MGMEGKREVGGDEYEFLLGKKGRGRADEWFTTSVTCSEETCWKPRGKNHKAAYFPVVRGASIGTTET